MKKSLAILGVFILIAFGSLLARSSKKDAPVASPSVTEAHDTATIVMNETGFEPNKIAISLGTTVTFVNEDTVPRWPATNIHPTHRIYPNSDINDCGTEKAMLMFDSCGGIPPDESWSFTFNEAGIWRMHDHLLPQFTGTIKVQ